MGDVRGALRVLRSPITVYVGETLRSPVSRYTSTLSRLVLKKQLAGWKGDPSTSERLD